MRWKGGKGGRIMRWPAGKGGRIMRWQGGKGGRVVGNTGGEHRVSPRFCFFVSDVNQGNEGDGLKIFLCACRDKKTLLRPSTSCSGV